MFKTHKYQKMEIPMLRREAKRVAFAVLGGTLLIILGLVPLTSAQDPGIQDSMIFGNFDGTPILAGLNSQIVVPVYIRTDDSVNFVHWPFATDNDYVASRDGGVKLAPLSQWDDVVFLAPDQNSPVQGFTSQSILGFHDLFGQYNPQYILYTNNEWWHIADYLITTTGDPSILGDTTFFAPGLNPQNGDLLMGDVFFNEIRPAIIYGSLYFPPNTPPQFLSPDSGTTPVNEQFGACFTVTATDADTNSMVLTVDFGPTDYTFNEIQNIPGFISYEFCWVPGEGDSGTYPLTFVVNDGNGGVIERHLTIVVTPAGLTIGSTSAMPGSSISLPVSLDNQGSSSAVGGFEILITWGPQALTLNGVTRAGRIGSFEYFHVNYDDFGPGTARIVGVADLRNGNVSPPLQPGTGEIFFLEMSVAQDEDLIGVELPVTFLNLDNADNTLSDSTGYLLVHPELTDGIVEIIGPDDIITGDINLNGEIDVGDVTLFVNHLTNPDLFPFSPIQREASDVNADGIPETVADLVYLINIVAGVIPPPGKLEPSDGNFILVISAENGRSVFSANSNVDLGAVLIRIAHGADVSVEPNSNGQFTLTYHDDGNVLSVLAYLPDGGKVAGGDIPLFELSTGNGDIAISEVQASDDIGHLLESSFKFEAPLPENYVLQQNYPNPFNATTRISFGLPQASDVHLDIYNITGQKVCTLLDGAFDAGWYNVDWYGVDRNGNALSSGVYFYRLQTADDIISMKMTMLK
jgi:hypothetical protein